MKAAIQESVEAIDRDRQQVWFRDGTLLRKGMRQPVDIVRAKTRRRTARWRAENDAAQRPEVSDIALALLHALLRSNLRDLTADERTLVGAALIDLHQRGYKLSEVLHVCKRVRRRLVSEDSRR